MITPESMKKALAKAKLNRYQKTLVEAVKAGTKYNVARKALLELKQTDAIKKALEEITKNENHCADVYRNTSHNIAVLVEQEDL